MRGRGAVVLAGSFLLAVGCDDEEPGLDCPTWELVCEDEISDEPVRNRSLGLAGLDASMGAVWAALDAGDDVQSSFDASLAALASELGVSAGGRSRAELVEATEVALASFVASSFDAPVELRRAPAVCRQSREAIEPVVVAMCGGLGIPRAAWPELRCQGRCGVEPEELGDCADVACAGVSPDCAGVCRGACEMDDGGECTGTCRGECEGSCAVAGPDGLCAGACQGTCQGVCELRVPGACDGRCEGTCDWSPAPGEPCPAQSAAWCDTDGLSGPECEGACEGELRLNEFDWPATCASAVPIWATALERCEASGMDVVGSPRADTSAEERSRARARLDRVTRHLERMELLATARASRLLDAHQEALTQLLPGQRRDIEASLEGALDLASTIRLGCTDSMIDRLEHRVELQQPGLREVVDAEVRLRGALTGGAR